MNKVWLYARQHTTQAELRQQLHSLYQISAAQGLTVVGVSTDIEDAVRDLVAELVGMPLGHGFGGVITDHGKHSFVSKVNCRQNGRRGCGAGLQGRAHTVHT